MKDVNADSGKEDVNGHDVEEDVKDDVEEDVDADSGKENANTDDEDDENVDDAEDVNSNGNENVGLEKKIIKWWSKIEEDSLTKFMKNNDIWEREETDKGKSAQIWKKLDLEEYQGRSLNAVQRKGRKLKIKAAAAAAKKEKGKGVRKGKVAKDNVDAMKGKVETDDAEKGARKGAVETGAEKVKGTVETDADKGKGGRKGEGVKEDNLETNGDAEKGEGGREVNVEAADISQDWEIVAERVQKIISAQCDAKKAEVNEACDNFKDALTKGVLREVKIAFYSKN